MKANINGIELYYEVHGRGEPLLFVHGFPLSGEMWMPLVEAMSGAYRLIIPDLRGHGRSAVGDECTMAEFASDLRVLLEEIGEARPPVLIGLSMGGYIAFEFYRRYPQRVRALVLADTRAEADAAERVQDRAETAKRVLREGSHVVADDMVDKLFAPDASRQLRDTWQRIMAATPPNGVAGALHAMAQRADSTETLANIAVPTLIVVGEKDGITPLDCARRMHRGITHSHLEVIPRVGHMVPVEAPQEFAKVLARFLGTLPPLT